MSVNKDESGKRWVSAEVEVPGTPEEVWQAIATGEGVSSWFVPTEKRDDGTVVSKFGPGMEVVAKETAYEPPVRFAAEAEMAPGGPKMATEWTVEAKAGGTCVVRVVHSLFADSNDWDDQLGAIEQGWPDYFEILKLYLRSFQGEPCSGMQLMGTACESADDVWNKVAGQLGFLNASAGESRTSPIDTLQLTGIVERGGTPGHPHQLLLHLTDPAPGIVHLFAMSMGTQVIVSMRFYLYGESAAKTVEVNEPIWRDWLNRLFPTPTWESSDESEPTTIQALATHRYRCSPEVVYDSWLDPEQIRAWMSNALKGFGLSGEMKRVEVDSKVGGKFCFSDIRNGSEAIHHGEYLELLRPERIIFTWMVGEESEDADLPSRVTLTITPDESGCTATIIHEMDAKWAEYVSKTGDGWKRMLESIGELVETL